LKANEKGRKNYETPDGKLRGYIWSGDVAKKEEVREGPGGFPSVGKEK